MTKNHIHITPTTITTTDYFKEKRTMIRMTWKQFEDKYQFEADENGSQLFSTSDSRKIEVEEKHGDNAWRYIWTVCSEGSDEYFVAGYAVVNRMDYMIATVPNDFSSLQCDLGETVEIVEDYDELSKRPKNELVTCAEPKLNSYLHYKKYDLWMDNHLVDVEIFAEQNIDGYVWFSLAIDNEIMETSEYKDWNPDEDHEDEKGEFDFEKLVKTELMGNRYLGGDIIADTFMKTKKWERHLPSELIEDYITEGKE